VVEIGLFLAGCKGYFSQMDTQIKFSKEKALCLPTKEVERHLPDIHRMIRLYGLILPPCAAIGKPGPSSLGLLAGR
jgi:hypothetical protein